MTTLFSFTLGIAGWIALSVGITAVLYGISSYRHRSMVARRLFHIKGLYGQHYQRKHLLKWSNDESELH